MISASGNQLHLGGRLRLAAVGLFMSCLLLARPCFGGGPPPVITAQPTNIAVPILGTATFSVGVAQSQTELTYQWYMNGSPILLANSSSLTLLSVLGLDVGTYYVIVANGGGWVTSSNAILSLLTAPAITTQPQNQTVGQGTNVSFSVVASGSTPLSYQWKFGGTALSGATNSTLTITSAQTGNAGSYKVVVGNAAGSATSRTATLAVAFPPGITTQPQNQSVRQGTNASFSVVASGSLPLSYQWNLNGAALSGATTSTLTIANVQTANAASYTVTVTNSWGSITSAVATLSVDIPPGITTQPQNLSVGQGTNASFSVVASGSTPFSYQWSFDGAALSGATTSTLTVANSQMTNAGSYTVTVTNAWGSITSAVATLSVHIPPGITTQPQSQTRAAGQSASFSLVATGATPLAYSWHLNGTALSGATNSTLALTSVRTTNAGNYTVVVTNIAGSVTSAVASLTVTNPNIILSLANSAGLTEAGFTFQFSVPIGITFVILASTNLETWAPIYTNISLTGTAVFTDGEAANYRSRLYLTKVQ